MDTLVSGGEILQDIGVIIGGAFGKILGTVAVIMLTAIYKHIKRLIDAVMQKQIYTLCYLKAVDHAHEATQNDNRREYTRVREQELNKLLQEEGFISPS